MAADPFHAQLAGLAVVYDRLAHENRVLKSLLKADGLPSERCVGGSCGAQQDLSLSDPAFELSNPNRILHWEAMHGALPQELAVVPSPPTTSHHSTVKPAHDKSSSAWTPVREEDGGASIQLRADATPGQSSDQPSKPNGQTHPKNPNGVHVCTTLPAVEDMVRQDSRTVTNESSKEPMSPKEPLYFSDMEDMKAQVREGLATKPKYDATEAYKQEGCSQAIAKSQKFEMLTLSVIALNAIWIAIDTDYNKADLLMNAHVVFQIAEHSFCVFFTFEILVRLAALKQKRTCCKDVMFLFDATLVILMVLETWVMNIVIALSASGSGSGTEFGNASVLRIARLLRLTRMARMARLLRAMPELLILVKGIRAAMRSVFFTLVLLCALLYVWAIACTQLMDGFEVGDVHFPNVLESMHTLWLYATLLDEITDLMTQVKTAGWGCVFLLDAFILAAALTVMNMLVGVLCDVVCVVAGQEREEASLALVKQKLEYVINELALDSDSNGLISKEEFRAIMRNREAIRAIQELGVDVVELVEMSETLFIGESDDLEERELTFEEFMDAVVQLRGSNYCTVKDLVRLRHLIQKQSRMRNSQTPGATVNMAAYVTDMNLSAAAAAECAKDIAHMEEAPLRLPSKTSETASRCHSLEVVHCIPGDARSNMSGGVHCIPGDARSVMSGGVLSNGEASVGETMVETIALEEESRSASHRSQRCRSA